MATVTTGLFLERWTGKLVPSEGPAILRLALRHTVGLACLSLICMVSALCEVFWVAGVITCLFVIRGSVGMVQAVRSTKVLPSIQRAVMPGVLLGALCLITWLWATIPPTFYDELVYHLAIPQRALATGSLPAYPWVFLTLMPHSSDLLLSWGMILGGDLGARAMHWTLWVSCVIAAWGFVEGILWPKAMPWAAGLIAGAMATSPTLLFLATLPFAETGLMLGVVSAAGLLVARSPDRRPWFALGLLLGFAGTVKLSGMAWVLAGVVAAWIIGWSWRDLLRTGVVVLVSVGPWWIRAYAHTGNPIYPMAYRWLGGQYWSETSQALLKGDLPSAAQDLGVMGVLRLPFDLVLFPDRFGSGSEAGLLAVVSLCVVLVLPALARVRQSNPRTRSLSDAAAVFCVIAGTTWLATSVTTRFFAPAFLLSLAIVLSLCLMNGRGGLIGAIVVVLPLGILGTAQFLDRHEAAFSSTRVALAQEKPEEYLLRTVGHYEAARFVQKAVPGDARLLFIGESRPYYFAREAIAPYPMDHHPLSDWVQEASSSDDMVQRLRREGITHVVLNVREFARVNKHYAVLAFTGEQADTYRRRLKELPGALNTLFGKNGVYILEVPPKI